MTKISSCALSLFRLLEAIKELFAEVLWELLKPLESKLDVPSIPRDIGGPEDIIPYAQGNPKIHSVMML
jgi:hypothetical protein